MFRIFLLKLFWNMEYIITNYSNHKDRTLERINLFKNKLMPIDQCLPVPITSPFLASGNMILVWIWPFPFLHISELMQYFSVSN